MRDPMCELLESLVMSTRLSREYMMKWNRLLPQSVDSHSWHMHN